MESNFDGAALEFINPDKTMELLQKAEPFIQLMMRYNCALLEVKTKFEVLDKEFSVRYKRNPVETIKTRIKQPVSICAKLKRKGLSVNMDSIENTIFDVAGVRIICSFIDDIYALADMFARQDDITVVAIKDYIKNPKPNGYRSLHYIVEIPIFLSDQKRPMKVEVQFRTIAMDFWASLEHKLKYKQNISNSGPIVDELKACSEDIAAVDMRMQALHRLIEEA
ncbi:MAG: GTP pyrophosphokinase family protein [Oscillospiraceae bacterium]